MSKKHIKTLLFFLFISLVLYTSFFHELWLDEAHRLNITKYSNSFFDYYNNMKNEGEPWLVEFFYFLSYKIYDSDLGPKLMNVSFSIIAAYLLLFRSKLPLSILVFVLFSYNLAYEYTVLVRTYSFALCFVILYCINYESYSRWRNILILLLIANSHNLFFMLVPFLFLIQFNDLKSVFKKQEMKYILFFGIGMLVTLYFSTPKNTHLIPGFHVGYMARLTHSLSGFTIGLFPLSNFTVSDWNSSFLSDIILRRYIALISIILLAVFYFQCKKTYKTTILFLSFFPVLIFYFIFPISAMRYFTIYYTIVLMILLLIFQSDTQVNKSFSYLVYVSLFISSISGVYFCIKDSIKPFSQSKNTALYLKQDSKKNDAIYVYPQSVYTTINHYYERNYLDATTGKPLTLSCLTCYGDTNLPESGFIDPLLLKLKTNNIAPFYFVTNRSLDSLINAKTDISIIVNKVSFLNAINKFENYTVYHFQTKTPVNKLR